jgi:uncharacterized protein YkwD
MVRENPQLLVPDLEKMLDMFDDRLLKRPNKTTLRTKEGAEAVKEAIEFLKKQPQVPPLKWSVQMAQASEDHAKDIGPKGLIQHDSSDNKTGVKERLRKYGTVIACYGENLSFCCETANEVLLQLIVDDGVPNRGHRENIFNKEFNFMGCFTTQHKDFDQMTCIDYAGGFVAQG